MRYDILVELHNQGKEITLYKVSAHIRIDGNEEAAKSAIDITEMTTTRLPHTDYFRSLGGLKTSSGKGNGKTVLLSYTTLNHALKNGKVSTTAIVNIVQTE